MINYYPHPQTKCSEALLYSDRPGIIHSSLATAAFPEWHTRGRRKEKGFFFCFCSTYPTFPPSDLLLMCRKSQWMHIIWWKNDSRHRSYPQQASTCSRGVFLKQVQLTSSPLSFPLLNCRWWFQRSLHLFECAFIFLDKAGLGLVLDLWHS